MKALEELKAALAATLLGTVIARRPSTTMNPMDIWSPIWIFSGTTSLKRRPASRGPLADLIAPMHNTLPALIECAEALEKTLRFFVSETCDHNVAVEARSALAKLEEP